MNVGEWFALAALLASVVGSAIMVARGVGRVEGKIVEADARLAALDGKVDKLAQAQTDANVKLARLEGQLEGSGALKLVKR